MLEYELLGMPVPHALLACKAVRQSIANGVGVQRVCHNPCTALGKLLGRPMPRRCLTALSGALCCQRTPTGTLWNVASHMVSLPVLRYGTT